MKDQTESIPIKIGQWQVLQKIGEGSFGCIFSAQSTAHQQPTQNKEEVAIKTELITNVKQMLLIEYKIYKEFSGCRGFPRVIEYGEEERYSYLVMEKFQMSLDKYAVTKFPKQFVPADTLLQIMSQTLRIIKQIHEKGYLYRDLKPANFIVKPPYQQIIIIDFGLCKSYLTNGRHISMKSNKKLVGTPLFCSQNTHTGIEQSRRDDLESWLWTCLFFAIELPWQSVIGKKQLTKEQQYQQIYKIKRETDWAALIKKWNSTSKTLIPSCIPKMIEYIRKIEFQERPKYEFLQKLIEDQYYGLFRTHLAQFTINWQEKAPLGDITEKQLIRDKNQEAERDKNESPRKVKKINFKIPIKPKAITHAQSQHTSYQAVQLNPLSNST